MSLADIIKAAMDQVQTLAKTETVIGEPIVAGNVTLIPVSRVSIGFAAGGAGNEQKSGSGAGTGGGVSIIPVAFVSIIDGKVHVHSVNKNEIDWGQLVAMAPGMIKKVQDFLGKKDDKKSEK